MEWAGDEFQLFLPAKLDGTLKVLGVWTQNCKPASHSYIGQFWHFLQNNIGEIDSGTVILGDFNSNSIWDKPRRVWNHTDCMNALGDLGLRSLYHLARGEAHGRESDATFYLHRKLEKPYHIDFVFAHDAMIGAGDCRIEVGSAEGWLTLSDHMPIVVDISE